MPFSVPSFFRTIGRFGTEYVARAHEIVSDHWYELARQVRWLWATVNPAAADFTLYGTGASRAPLSESDHTTQVLQARAFLSLRPGRTKVDAWARYASGTVQIKFVPVFGTSGGTVTWTSATRAPAAGTGEDNATVTLTAGGRYRMDIHLQAHSAGNDCDLYATRAREIQMSPIVAAGNYIRVSTAMLPTAGTYFTWRSLFQQWAKNLNEIASEHLHSSTIPLLVNRPLLLHGNPHKLCTPPLCFIGALEHGEVTVAIHYECVDEDVAVWAALLTDEGITPLESEHTFTAGTSGDHEFTVTIPTSERLRAGRAGLWGIVLVADSEEDTPNAITVTPNASDSFETRYVKTVNAAGLTPSSKVYKLHFDDSGGAYDAERLPAPRLVLGEYLTGGNWYFIWPLLSWQETREYGYGTPGDYAGKQGIVFTPIGYLKISAIEVRASEYKGGTIRRQTYAGGMRTSSRWLRKIPATSERLFRRRVPLQAMSAVDLAATEGDPDGISAPYNDGVPIMPFGALTQYAKDSSNNQYETMAVATVGACPEARDTDDVKHYRDVYEVFGYVACFQRRTERDGDREVTVQLELVDPDDAGTSATGDEVPLRVEPWPLGLLDSSPNNFGALLWQWRRDVGSQVQRNWQHSANSLMPYELALRQGLRGLKLFPFRATVTEDSGETTTTERMLKVKIKGPSSSDGPFYGDNDNCWTWLAGYQASVQRLPLR